MTDIGQQLGAIVQSLEDIKGDVTELKRDTREDLREIRTQTTRTNGRVTALETVNEVRARLEAQREAQRQRTLKVVTWSLGVVVAVFGGALGTLILGVH